MKEKKLYYVLIIIGVIVSLSLIFINLDQTVSEITHTNQNGTTIKLHHISYECIGYCWSNITITSEKIKYSATGSASSLGKMIMLPEIINEISISKTEWQKLLDVIDFPQFLLLSDRIGCPGCTDAQVEKIEISMNGLTKSISFENSDNIPEINDLRIKLEEMYVITIPLIHSFEECKDAGYDIGITYPWQCITNEGQVFVKTSVDNFEECKDAGYDIIQTEPRQCEVNMFKKFIEK